MKLIIASKNLHKIREIRSMLKNIPELDLYSLIDFPDYVPVEETEASFEDNAKAKALHAARKLGSYVIADDSGLVVPALNGSPGIHSARYAGEGATDKENRTKLLEAMEGFSGDDRDAYFACCIALASPNGVEKVFSAQCEGIITTSERGGQGFGYDPIFQKHDYSKTFAELEEEVKNQISHRRKALDKLLLYLENHALSH